MTLLHIKLLKNPKKLILLPNLQQLPTHWVEVFFLYGLVMTITENKLFRGSNKSLHLTISNPLTQILLMNPSKWHKFWCHKYFSAFLSNTVSGSFGCVQENSKSKEWKKEGNKSYFTSKTYQHSAHTDHSMTCDPWPHTIIRPLLPCLSLIVFLTFL